MGKKPSARFAKSSGHVFNHQTREIYLKESVLGVGLNMKAADGILSNHGW